MAELGVHQSALLTDLALCVNRYRLFSPGWYVCVLAKVQLSPEESEVPGLVAMVNYGRKKQCEAHEDAFHGAPNFVLDVFYSEDDQDFLRRRDRFCNFGVQEYLVAFVDAEPGVLWHRLDAGCYRLVEPDEDGIIRSHALPNLWLPLKAVHDRDWWTVLGCIERGVSRRANFA
jgi:Uma2 family endonuclease